MLAALLEQDAGEHDSAVAAHLEACAVCWQTLIDLAADSATRAEIARQLTWVKNQLRVDEHEPAYREGLARLLVQLKEGTPTAGERATFEEEGEELTFLQVPTREGLLGHFAGYDVMEVIGRGGMGIVLKAYEPALGRVVALKVLAPRLAMSSNARRRFVREGRLAAALSHDNIVTIHGVSETAGLPFLVMQHVVGKSLQDRLDRVGALKLTEIIQIGMQTAAGLAAAHAEGLIHRDIKPANLLLEAESGRVKITDFGLARMVDDSQLTQNGVIAGTPAYMAPEQARGESIDHRADLFSLGSVLYAMATGTPPFVGSPALVVLRQVIDETPRAIRALNAHLPVWLETLVSKLMAKEPAQRCQSAAEVAALLEAGGKLASTPARAGRWTRGVGIALAATLLAGVVLLAQSSSAPKKEASAAEIYYDFRGQPLPPTLFVFGEEKFVREEPEGLRITMPEERKDLEAISIATGPDAFSGAGDFEVTTTLEILAADSPPGGYGVGLCLHVKKAPPFRGSAAVCRLVRAKNNQILLWDQAFEPLEPGGKPRFESGEVPCTDNVVRLRIKRSGSTLEQSWAAGSDGDDFHELQRFEFGKEAIGRMMVNAVTGANAASWTRGLSTCGSEQRRTRRRTWQRPDLGSRVSGWRLVL